MKAKDLMKTLKTIDPETDIYVSEKGVGKHGGEWYGELAQQTAVADNYDGSEPFLIIASY